LGQRLVDILPQLASAEWRDGPTNSITKSIYSNSETTNNTNSTEQVAADNELG